MITERRVTLSLDGCFITSSRRRGSKAPGERLSSLINRGSLNRIVSFTSLPRGGQIRFDLEGYFAGAPELIIEIARSSRAFDLGAKKVDYERAGVREYVVVELDPDQIHWFIRRDDHFNDLPPGPDGVYRSEIFPGLWLDPRALYSENLDRLIEVLDQGLATPAHAAFLARLEKARHGASRST